MASRVTPAVRRDEFFSEMLQRKMGPPVPIPPNLTQLDALVEEEKCVRSRRVKNVKVPTRTDELLKELFRSNSDLPPVYQKVFGAPLLSYLQRNQRGKLSQEYMVLIEDATRAIILNGSTCPRVIGVQPGFFCDATKAAQELASDLYDQFVDALGPAFPRERTTPSLHTWKNVDGPYTYPITDLERLGLKATMVVMPAVNAIGGIFAWTTYAHEVAGHNLLHAGRCLNGELQEVVRRSVLRRIPGAPELADYWASRVDETVSDVLGILRLGPAGAVGMVGYFRSFEGDNKLRADGPAEDSHPSDLVRGLLAAKVISRLRFANAQQWRDALQGEVMNDWPVRFSYLQWSYTLDEIELGGHRYKRAEVIASVRAVANAVLFTPLECMGRRSLHEIGAWNDMDMTKTSKAMEDLRCGKMDRRHRYRASHVVSASTLLALKCRVSDIPEIFRRMVSFLSEMHQLNPHWAR